MRGDNDFWKWWSRAITNHEREERERERKREEKKEEGGPPFRRRQKLQDGGCGLSERGEEEGGPLPIRYSDDDSRRPMRATRTGPNCPRLLSWEVTMTTTHQSATREAGGKRRDKTVVKAREVRPAKHGE